MKTKHTPGPWTVEDPMGAEIGLSIVQGGLKTYEWEFIAMICQSDESEERMGRQRFISPEEQAANALLMAAAPELLEALKLFVRAEKMARDGNPPQDADRLIELGDAAIAKAEAQP